jgi:hypothetical protein
MDKTGEHSAAQAEISIEIQERQTLAVKISIYQEIKRSSGC